MSKTVLLNLGFMGIYRPKKWIHMWIYLPHWKYGLFPYHFTIWKSGKENMEHGARRLLLYVIVTLAFSVTVYFKVKQHVECQCIAIESEGRELEYTMLRKLQIHRVVKSINAQTMRLERQWRDEELQEAF